MENSHGPDELPPLPPETFAPDRWVPCMVNEDEECLHYGCQAMEPLDIDAQEDDYHDDDPPVEFTVIELRFKATPDE